MNGIAPRRFSVTDDPYGLGVGRLFQMAERRNAKRGHLFVSTVLGKHLPVDPREALDFGALLGRRWLERSGAAVPEGDRLGLARGPGPDIGAPLVLGFAETATALGHAFADELTRVWPATTYVHSTRLAESGSPLAFGFEEEHSHATSHRVVADSSWFDHDRPVLLVDDELTTGRTALNTVRALQAAFPRRHYGLATYLDWRGPDDRAAFAAVEAELGVTVDVVSLQAGTIDSTAPGREARPSGSLDDGRRPRPLTVTVDSWDEAPVLHARHGWTAADTKTLEAFAHDVAASLCVAGVGSGPVLCLGVEEFMYAPMRVAAAMGRRLRGDAMVAYQTTTRSPILIRDEPGYAVRHGISFDEPGEPGRASFVYNLAPAGHPGWDHVFVFFDGPRRDAALEPFVHAVAGCGATSNLHLVFLGADR